MNRTIFIAAIATVAIPVSRLQAQTTPSANDSGPGTNVEQGSTKPTPANGGSSIVITGRRLDVARDAITPSLGASQYTFDREALEKQPGGTNLTLNKSLLQAPGVAQDSYGVIHVRNEHANLQYRLDGVIIPESISGFGTTFDPKIASSIQLITGTLPAQYGYRTSGVVNFTTQSGLLNNGGSAGAYGGSYGWIEPSVMVKGSTGNFSYFLSGSYLRNDIGIENPLPTHKAIHDRTTQWRPFAYISDILSDSSRISLFGGSFIGHFQIPNLTGVTPGFTVNGVSSYDAARLDQNQRARNGSFPPKAAATHFDPLRRRGLSICRDGPEPSACAVRPIFADAVHARSEPWRRDRQRLRRSRQADQSRKRRAGGCQSAARKDAYRSLRRLLPERAHLLERRFDRASGRLQLLGRSELRSHPDK
jgi:hypothetical protein